jgi:hypothetical protein
MARTVGVAMRARIRCAGGSGQIEDILEQVHVYPE